MPSGIKLFHCKYFLIFTFMVVTICFNTIAFAETILPPYTGAHIKNSNYSVANFGSGFALTPNSNYSNSTFNSNCSVFSWSTASYGHSGMSVIDDYRIPISVNRSGKYKIDADISIQGRIVAAKEDAILATEFADIEVKLRSMLRDSTNEDYMTNVQEIDLCIDEFDATEVLEELQDTSIDMLITYASGGIGTVKLIATSLSTIGDITALMEFADKLENPLKEFEHTKPESNYKISLTAESLHRDSIYELSIRTSNKCIVGSYGVLATVFADSRFEVKVNSIHLTFLDASDYVITAHAASGGSIDPEGDVYVDEGSSKTFNATPDTGYEVDRWYIDGEDVGGSTSSILIENIQTDKTVSVTFKRSNPDSESQSLYPSGDVIIKNQSGTKSSSNSSSIVITQNSGNDWWYGLMKFDLTEIPQGSTISSATFKLKSYLVDSGFDYATINPCGTPWSESSTNWESHPSYPGNFSLWNYNNSQEWWEWTDSSGSFAFRDSVQSWLDNPSQNYGFYIFPDNSGYEALFRSNDHYSSDDRPALIVAYTPPVQPDLIVTSFSPNPSQINNTYYVGDSISWNAIIKNNSGNSAGESEVGYYIGNSPDDLSTTLSPDPSDTVDALSVGESVSENSVYVFKSSDLGQRYLICLADNDDEVDESQEENNTWVYGPFNVVLPKVATPSISPNDGAYTGSTQVEITCSTPSATIRYTTDGTTPTSSSTQYTGAFTVGSSSTVIARGFETGHTDSNIASTSFTITPEEIDTDDLPDDGEVDNFGNLTAAGDTTDTYGDGDVDGVASGVIVDPNNTTVPFISDTNNGGTSDAVGEINGNIINPSSTTVPSINGANDDGAGSDTGTGSGGGEEDDGKICFIATAAFGSYMEPNVTILRKFRDSFLLTNSIGEAFVEKYYKYSPPLANLIAEHGSLKAVVRLGLLPLVGLSWAILNYGFLVTMAAMLIIISGILFSYTHRKKLIRILIN